MAQFYYDFWSKIVFSECKRKFQTKRNENFCKYGLICLFSVLFGKLTFSVPWISHYPPFNEQWLSIRHQPIIIVDVSWSLSVGIYVRRASYLHVFNCSLSLLWWHTVSILLLITLADDLVCASNCHQWVSFCLRLYRTRLCIRNQ